MLAFWQVVTRDYFTIQWGNVTAVQQLWYASGISTLLMFHVHQQNGVLVSFRLVNFIFFHGDTPSGWPTWHHRNRWGYTLLASQGSRLLHNIAAKSRDRDWTAASDGKDIRSS